MTEAANAIEALNKSMQAINDKLGTLEKSNAEDRDGIQAILKGGSAPMFSRGGYSTEAMAVKAFGARDIKSLVQTNVMAPQFARLPEELKHSVLELKKSIDIGRWIAQRYYGAPMDEIGETADKDRAGRVSNILETPYGKSVLAPMVKSFLSTGVGVGAETLQTVVSSQYIDEYQLDRVIEDSVQSFPLPSATYSMPIVNQLTEARQIAENTAMIDKNFGTGLLTFSAKKIGEYFIIPSELDEDSIIPFLEIGRREVVESQRRAVEQAIINGDADGAHIDSDTQALPADVAAKLWNGWRRAALANSANGGTVDFGNAPATDAKLNQMRANMGKFGINTKELLWIFGSGNSISLQTLPTVRTMEQYGQAATIINGELAKYAGIPIVVSEYMRNNLNATGVYDGITMDRSGILLVNARRWWIGRRRPITLKIQQDLPMQDRYLIASYQRLDFKGMPQSASEKSVVYGYNVHG